MKISDMMDMMQVLWNMTNKINSSSNLYRYDAKKKKLNGSLCSVYFYYILFYIKFRQKARTLLRAQQ